MKSSTKSWVASAAMVVAAGTAIAMLTSGKKSKLSEHALKESKLERLSMVREKLEHRKSRIEKHLAKINAKLSRQEVVHS